MKRLSLFAGLVMLLSLAGCAAIPAHRSLSPAEESRGIAAFRRLAAVQKACALGADAEVDVTFDSFWKSGALSGDLQLLEPGYLRFIGLNPLGQPLLILSTDGRDFSAILPAEMRGYTGKLAALSARRYIPAGWRPDAAYYWLIGRLPPGMAKVLEVTGSADGSALWAKLSYGGSAGEEMVRFDPERLTISRHQMLDKRGRVVLDVTYGGYSGSPCALPGRLTIRGGLQKGTLSLRFKDWRTGEPFAPQAFAVAFPPGFKRIEIK